MKSITLLACLAFGAFSALSQVPTAPFAYSITNLPLWDFSGQYQMSVQGDTTTFQLVHNANGKLTGTSTEVAITDTENLYASAYVTGRAFWTPTSVGFNVNPYKETMTGTVNGYSILAHATVHGRATLVPSLLAVQTTSVARVCVMGGKCATSTQGYQVPLPAGMTGEWALSFALTQLGNKVSGTAQIALSNGRTLNYNVKGTYNPRTQVSTLRLVGYLETQGTSLVVKTQGTEMQLLSLSGSVLGQKLKL